MAMTSTPAFIQTPVSILTALSATANTSRAVAAGTPTNGVLISPNTNANGVRVDQLRVQGTGTTVAGQVVIWLYDGANSTPIEEFTVPAVTPNTTTTPAHKELRNFDGFVLQAGCKLYATSQVASQLAAAGMIGWAY